MLIANGSNFDSTRLNTVERGWQNSVNISVPQNRTDVEAVFPWPYTVNICLLLANFVFMIPDQKLKKSNSGQKVIYKL